MRPDQRVVVLYADDVDATDDLRHLLSVVARPPWHHQPEGARMTDPQTRWSDAEIDQYIVTIVRRISGRVQWAGALLSPDEPGAADA